MDKVIQESIDWAKSRAEDFCGIRDAKNISEQLPFRVFSFDDPQEPEWAERAFEVQYRKGFQYGIIEAARAIRSLYRGGFSRPTEIANLLEAFASSDLHEWRRRTESESPFRWHGEPKLKQSTWWEIRDRLIERDGCCVRCGSKENMEVHHIVPVSEGGLPNEENLEALCFGCHRGARK
jgi:hypothetical protein